MILLLVLAMLISLGSAFYMLPGILFGVGKSNPALFGAAVAVSITCVVVLVVVLLSAAF